MVHSWQQLRLGCFLQSKHQPSLLFFSPRKSSSLLESQDYYVILKYYSLSGWQLNENKTFADVEVFGRSWCYLSDHRNQLAMTWWILMKDYIGRPIQSMRWLIFFFKNLRISVLFVGPLIPCFGLPVTSAWVSKSGWISSFACFITHMQWISQIHLWCNTCWPVGGQDIARGILINVLAHMGLESGIDQCRCLFVARQTGFIAKKVLS